MCTFHRTDRLDLITDKRAEEKRGEKHRKSSLSRWYVIWNAWRSCRVGYIQASNAMGRKKERTMRRRHKLLRSPLHAHISGTYIYFIYEVTEQRLKGKSRVVKKNVFFFLETVECKRCKYMCECLSVHWYKSARTRSLKT